MSDYFGEDAGKRIVSAVEKRIIAQQKKNEFAQISSSKVAICVVLVLSFILAYLLTNGVLVEGLPYAMGNALDVYFFGPGNAEFAGDPTIDMILTVFVRGLIVFVLFGLVPALTLGWQTVLRKTHVNGYVAVWGTLVGLTIVLYLLRDTLISTFG